MVPLHVSSSNSPSNPSSFILWFRDSKKNRLNNRLTLHSPLPLLLSLSFYLSLCKERTRKKRKISFSKKLKTRTKKKMMMMMASERRRTWPNFSPWKSTNRGTEAINDPLQLENPSPATNTIIAHSLDLLGRHPKKKRDSTGSCPAWRRSMNSIFEICSSDSQTPSSSPRDCSNRSFNSSEIISFSSTTSDAFFSQVSTSFSTPKYKSPCRYSTDRIEEAAIIDDNDFQSCYYQASLQRGSGEQQINQHECRLRCWSFSSEGFRTIGPCQPLLDMPLMVDSAERYDVDEETENWGSGYDSDQSTADRHQRMTNRPKPYQAFLDEIKRKELEAQVNAWTEAKQQKLMNRLSTQEAVIHAWELKQTMKATIEMKKIESKLERRRAKAMEKMHKNLSNSRRKANKMKARERQTIANKLTTISRITDKVRDTGKFIWVKFSCCW